MKATVTFEKEIERKPERCADCVFAEACDAMGYKLTKRGGFEWRAAALRGTPRNCPLTLS